MREYKEAKGRVNTTLSFKYKTCTGQEAIPYSTCVYHLKYILSKMGIRSDDVANPKKIYSDVQVQEEKTAANGSKNHVSTIE